eukprot:5297924-Amphidinium_carterae.1
MLVMSGCLWRYCYAMIPPRTCGCYESLEHFPFWWPVSIREALPGLGCFDLPEPVAEASTIHYNSDNARFTESPSAMLACSVFQREIKKEIHQ